MGKRLSKQIHGLFWLRKTHYNIHADYVSFWKSAYPLFLQTFSFGPQIFYLHLFPGCGIPWNT